MGIEKSMFLNLTNHPWADWPEAQRVASVAIASPVVDIPFPNVPPDADEVEVEALGREVLEQLARHSLVDIKLRAKGDAHIDFHHSTEDCGIALGQAVAKALAERVGIRRYASLDLAMDGFGAGHAMSVPLLEVRV